jgi:hypothetical protein
MRRFLQVTPVKTCLAIVLYTLSLFGIDVGSHIRVDRVRSNDADVLYSKVVSEPTGTRFECVRSVSGQCYYTVFSGDCATGPQTDDRPTACTSQPEHFAIADGGSRKLAALPAMRMCVSADPNRSGAACR